MTKPLRFAQKITTISRGCTAAAFTETLPAIAVRMQVWRLLVVLLCCVPIEAASAAAPAAGITLRVSNWSSQLRDIEYESRILREFERLHPGVRAVLEPVPANYDQKILTSIVAGSPPDVFLLDSGAIPSYVNKGVVRDLMPYMRRRGFDLSVYFPNVLAIAQRDSALYALPKDFTPLVLYYNKRLFDEAGVPYPPAQWQWHEFLAAAQRLTRDTDGDGENDQFGVIWPQMTYMWMPVVWMHGGDVFAPDGSRATGYFDSAPTKTALQRIIDLQLKHKVAPNLGSHEQVRTSGLLQSLFVSNRAAMRISGHWSLPAFQPYIASGQLRLGVTALPVPENGKKVNVMYESGWCVPVATPHPDLAVELALFLSGEFAARLRREMLIGLPAMKAVALEQVQADTLGLEQVFFAEVPYARQHWGSRVERFSEIEPLFEDALDAVLFSGKSIDESFARQAQRIDEKLRQIRARSAGRATGLRGNTAVLSFLLVLAALAFVLAIGGMVAGRRNAGMAWRRDQTWKGFLFLLPSFVHLLIFLLTPIVFAVYLSVHDWEIIVPDKPFVGAGNYVEMFRDPLFWNALKNTLLYSLNVPLGMAVALGVAVLLNRRLAGVNVLRTLFFLPSVSSFVAIALVWRLLYEPQIGLANFLLDLAGLPKSPWLNSPQTAMLAIVLMSIWLGLGYQMVVFLAGLQSIPATYYEAAMIDGASGWQRFRTITLPLLQPTTFFILVTSLIGSFQVFTAIYVMTGGGPARSTDVVVHHIYQAAWANLRMGYASAMSMVLFVIIMIATWLQFRLLGKQVDYA